MRTSIKLHIESLRMNTGKLTVYGSHNQDIDFNNVQHSIVRHLSFPLAKCDTKHQFLSESRAVRIGSCAKCVPINVVASIYELGV